jgi:hypothetical protein
MRHDGPTFLKDEDGFVAQCSCGWETTIYEFEKEAEQEFDEQHFYAGYEPDDVPLSWTHDKNCSFCGNHGHSDKECSRKPLLKI